MKTIEIDEQVYAAIKRRVEDFNESPNAVLRKVLGVTEKQHLMVLPENPSAPSLDGFLRGGDYISATTADERYLKLIAWLLQNHIELQARLDGYRLRKRILFSKDTKEIESSGQGVIAKRIVGLDFPFFAMVTLDNPSKRKIIKRVLALAGYSPSSLEQALNTLPDSGIIRGENRRLLEKYK